MRPGSETDGRRARRLAGCVVAGLLLAWVLAPSLAQGRGAFFRLSVLTPEGWLEASGGAIRLPSRLSPWTGLKLQSDDRIQYRVLLAGHGWSPWREGGACAGCVDAAITAVQVRFAAPIRYRVHVAAGGWQEWRGTGAMAGQAGGPAIDGLEIVRAPGPFHPRDYLRPRLRPGLRP